MEREDSEGTIKGGEDLVEEAESWEKKRLRTCEPR